MLELVLSTGQSKYLSESSSICEFLNELEPNPNLLPADIFARQKVREAVQIINSASQPLQNVAVQNKIKEEYGVADASGVSGFFVRKALLSF